MIGSNGNSKAYDDSHEFCYKMGEFGHALCNVSLLFYTYQQKNWGEVSSK